jgi:hypothetical protein
VKVLVFAFAVLALAPPAVQSQQPGTEGQGTATSGRRSSVEIIIPPAPFISRDAPTIVTRNPLTRKDAEALIRNGYPARLRYTAELWSASGIVGKATSTARWETLVQYEPLQKVFQIVRATGVNEHQPLGSYASFSEVIAVISRGYQPRLRPPSEPGRYYYAVTLEVERLNANDLADVRSWLGTPSSAQDNPGRSFLGFIAQVFTHLIGAEKERYKRQSKVFEVVK